MKRVEGNCERLRRPIAGCIQVRTSTGGDSGLQCGWFTIPTIHAVERMRTLVEQFEEQNGKGKIIVAGRTNRPGKILSLEFRRQEFAFANPTGIDDVTLPIKDLPGIYIDELHESV